MPFSSIIVCVACLLLQSVRRGIFHTDIFSFHDPIFYFVDIDEPVRSVLRKKLLCNLCFILICAGLARIAQDAFRVNRTEILWGIGAGTFCMTWPFIYIYRLYAFWRNPAAFAHLFLNTSEVAYAVCMADFFLTWNPLCLFAIIIPAIGGLLRRWVESLQPDLFEEMAFETILFTTWKKIRLREAPLLKKYGKDIEEACREYRLPPRFLTRFLLIGEIEHGMWYYKWYKHFFAAVFPKFAVKLRLTLGIGAVKPQTAAKYCPECCSVPAEILVKRLCKPRESIRILACFIRALIDGYPGAGNYISEADVKSSRCGALEYETLSETAQLCRYVACQRNAGLPYSRKDFADIYLDVLLKSDADQLLKENKVE